MAKKKVVTEEKVVETKVAQTNEDSKMTGAKFTSKLKANRSFLNSQEKKTVYVEFNEDEDPDPLLLIVHNGTPFTYKKGESHEMPLQIAKIYEESRALRAAVRSKKDVVRKIAAQGVVVSTMSSMGEINTLEGADDKAKEALS